MMHSNNGGNDSNSHLPSLFDDVEQLNAAQNTNGLLPLDAFLLEGDERTWSMDEWTWDAENMFAAQKDTLAPHPCCEALQRGRQPIQPVQAAHNAHNPNSFQHAPPHSHAPTQCHGGNSHSQNMQNWSAARDSMDTCQPGHPPACHHAASTVNGMLNYEKSLPAEASAKPVWMHAGAAESSSKPSWMQADHAGFHPSLVDLHSAPTVLPIVLQRPPVPQPDTHSPHALNFPSESTLMPSNLDMHSANQYMSAPVSRPVRTVETDPLGPAASASTAPPAPAPNSNVAHALMAMWDSLEHDEAVPAVPPHLQGVVPQLPELPPMPPAKRRALSPFEAAPSHSELLLQPQPQTQPQTQTQTQPHTQTQLKAEDVFEGLEGLLPSGVPILQGPPPEGANPMICQVVGCSSDLSALKEYHHKYHVCDVHIRLPQVVKEGRLQRFCQQCGRFHDLAAFDNNRKSCREQLSKHNARRRMRTKIDRVKGKVAGPADSFKTHIAPCPSGAVSNPNPGLLSATHSCALADVVRANSTASGFDTSEPLTAVAPAPGPPACETPAPPHPAASAGVAPINHHHNNSNNYSYGNNCNRATGKESAGASAEGDVGQLLSALMQQPAQLNALRLLLGVQTNAVLPVMRPFRPENSNGEDPNAFGAAAGSEPSSYSVAREILDGKGGYTPHQYSSAHATLRVSMKLFGRTPADLPPDIRQHVTSWLSATPVAVEGLIRPGCVFLTMQLLLDRETYHTALTRGVQGLVDHLLHTTNCVFWRTGVYTVQVDKDLASLTNGQVTGFFSAYPSQLMQLPAEQADIVPQLESLSPICVVASHPLQDPPSAVSIKLQGSQLDTSGLGVMCRQRGLQLKGRLTTDSSSSSSQDHTKCDTPSVSERDQGYNQGYGSSSGTTAHLAPFTRCGLALVELSRNAFLTDALPLLVVDNAAIAAEVCSLEKMGLPPLVVREVLIDLGAVLHKDGFPATSFLKTADGARQLQLKLDKVLAFACDHGWAAVVKALLHAGSTLQTPPHAHPAPPGLSLSFLHRAVRSGSLPTIQVLFNCGRLHGHTIRPDQWGPLGITPLHLAALAPDVKLALALMNPECCPHQEEAFSQLVTEDGVTPFHLALQMGNFDLSNMVKVLSWSQVATAQDGGKPALVFQSRSKKHAGEVDPCQVCHSSVPPLVLSIAASCFTCGMERSCLSEDDSNNGVGDLCCSPNPPPFIAATAPTDKCCGSSSTLAGPPAGADLASDLATRGGPVGGPNNMNAGGDSGQAVLRMPSRSKCGHNEKETRFRIKALCQNCHVNRCLEAA